ncbi:hypothetical protein ABT009_23790 [Streptomyces sp. NPDC002896]|uniref:hypothetical protein n=1 Tax=Streptomyces sp. NPDC002896 TaxID=3154438 RepID=UPI003330E3FE
MSGLTITLIVIAVVIVFAAIGAFVASAVLGSSRGLKRRFGPEYERTVARHDGDTKAAERDLSDRVKRHGSLRTRPLEPAARDGYVARWTYAQERFVDSPGDAVAEADRLLAEVAAARGFPDGVQYEEQVSALSVHHGPHVNGYRRVHRVAQAGTGALQGTGAGTEEMRAALLDARALFDDLVAEHGTRAGRSENRHRAGRGGAVDGASRPSEGHGAGRLHALWAFNRHHPKRS